MDHDEAVGRRVPAGARAPLPAPQPDVGARGAVPPMAAGARPGRNAAR